MAEEPKPTTVIGRPFQRGVSGNPGGKPKGLAAFRKALAGTTQERLDALLELARHKSPAIRLDALKLLLSYELGKPPQALELSGPEGGPIDNRSASFVVTQPIARDSAWRLKVLELLQNSGALQPPKLQVAGDEKALEGPGAVGGCP